MLLVLNRISLRMEIKDWAQNMVWELLHSSDLVHILGGLKVVESGLIGL